MPSFKPKNTKKIKFLNKKNSITIDGKHKEFLSEFSKDENYRIPELNIEKQKLKKQLENLNENDNIEEKLNIQDRINEIKQLINVTKLKKK